MDAESAPPTTDSPAMCASPVPSIVVTDTEETNPSPPVQRRRLTDSAVTKNLPSNDDLLINSNCSEKETSVKHKPGSQWRKVSDVYGRRRSSSSISGSSGSRRNSEISDDESVTESRYKIYSLHKTKLQNQLFPHLHMHVLDLKG